MACRFGRRSNYAKEQGFELRTSGLPHRRNPCFLNLTSLEWALWLGYIQNSAIHKRDTKRDTQLDCASRYVLLRRFIKFSLATKEVISLLLSEF